MNTHYLLWAMFLVLMINITQSQGNDDLYSNCSSLFHCGNIQGVGHPFWGGNRSNDCGYPALQLACEDNSASIMISNVKYKVLDVDPNNEVLQIAREDFFSGLCSPDFTNTTLDPALFSVLQGYNNFTFVYGCRTGMATNDSSHFFCAISGLANGDGYLVSGAVGPGSCSKSVVAPFSQDLLSNTGPSSACSSSSASSGGSSSASSAGAGSCSASSASSAGNGSASSSSSAGAGSRSANLEMKLQQGFAVKLGVDSEACQRCTTSKGVCGYDISTNTTVCYCANASPGLATCVPSAAGGPRGQPGSKGFNKRIVFFTAGVFAIGVSIFAIGIIFILKFTNGVFSWKLLLFKKEKDCDIEKLMDIHGNLVPRRYRYIDVKKMTNSFSEKLGQGGFGAVYKGKIRDGCLVAVKILTESRSSPEEFINEVVSISRTSHVNVITLLGFCFEGNKKALIFEYMPNGSLDKFISSGKALSMSSSLEWKILYQIAIGIARGLEYLHRGCNTRILHFDIKPQNILLDQDFIPKISDFGLSKLCHGKGSAVSTLRMRGTVGYIAPEVVYRNLGRVSPKSDVYSYGKLVLEMVGCRNSDIRASNSCEMHFPEWIYRNFEPGQDLKLPMNLTEEEEMLARKMTIVSLWCIQTSPSDRPPIVKVIEMLEGSFESLQMPPKPTLYSPTPPSSQHGEIKTSNSNGRHEEERILDNLEECDSKWQSGNA